MGKGVTLNKGEVEQLKKLLAEIDPEEMEA
jgi:hypothetical protein